MQTISPISVAALAAAKHLDIDFLVRTAGLEASRWRGEPAVRFPYRDASGSVLFYKSRVANGGRNPAGAELTAYGLEQLRAAPADAPLIVVEGESDCWCLWQHGFGALGVPGASSLRRIWTNDVAALIGRRRLVLWQEPGKSGEELIVSAARVLAKDTGVIRGALPSEKDPCELLGSADPSTFSLTMRARIATAVPLIQQANQILATRPAVVRTQPPRRRHGDRASVTPHTVEQARSVSTVAWLTARSPRRFYGQGRNRSTRCPFPDHDDRTPSFSVSVETGAWCCFGCGRKGGDVIDLVRQLTGCTFQDAILELVG